jgi:hypothetical protein
MKAGKARREQILTLGLGIFSGESKSGMGDRTWLNQ